MTSRTPARSDPPVLLSIGDLVEDAVVRHDTAVWQWIREAGFPGVQACTVELMRAKLARDVGDELEARRSALLDGDDAVVPPGSGE